MIDQEIHISFRPKKPRTTESNGFVEVLSSGFYLPLVRTLIDHAEKCFTGATFIFTSTAPREGVSMVTDAIARELAASTGEKILIAKSSAIPKLGASTN